MRDYLISLGIEWVLQGTGDQHISYQQVLKQPQKYLPFLVSFVPETETPALPAVGFAKGYLDNVSVDMVRDYFMEASYRALTEKRRDEGGKGLFIRMTDSEKERMMLKKAMALAVSGGSISNYTREIDLKAREMLAGVRPWNCDDPAELAAMHRESKPNDIRQHRPELSDELAELIQAMLAKDPLRRPASARELATTLVRFEIASFSLR